MSLYCGLDLHSSNSYLVILDQKQQEVASRRVRNDLGQILGFLEPFRADLESVAVESTYNWYWLVDGLREAGYDTRLVNTTKASDYSGLKYTDDRHDARWIASLMVLGILPEGYVLAPQERRIRDLLRRRSFLVRKRTDHLLSVQTQFERSTGKRVSVAQIRKWDSKAVHRLVDDPFVAKSMAVALPVVRVLTSQIKAVEKSALAEGRLRAEFELLHTVPGIGNVLALTIMYETGDIGRFARVGNYASYCRHVKSEKRSNHKKKGEGNRKNGNKYLSWAYAEAAHHSLRYEPLAKRFYDRKRKKRHPMVASGALANKLARACYYVLRDQVPFDPSRAFG